MKTRVMRLILIASAVILVFAAAHFIFQPQTESVDYFNKNNWAYFSLGDGKDADLFLVCPTVFLGDAHTSNMPLSDEGAKASFLGALNMERGIYEENCRMFAPYYRQAALCVYTEDKKQSEMALEAAYQDVRAAFLYYLEHENGNRPIILAGFSQGADMCLRLLKEFFRDEDMQNRLAAAYIIGWRVTKEDLAACPWLHMAQGESDTGTIICFSSEAPEVTASLIIPEGTKSFSINPLNWKTDGTPAVKSENKGACFTNYSGVITKEIPNLCGCYLDPVRGALKVTDITPEEYPPVLSIFQDGVYHLYDYQFFFRNLQQNVDVRLNAWMQANAKAALRPAA